MSSYGVKDGMSVEEKRKIWDDKRKYYKNIVMHDEDHKKRDEASEHVTILANLINELKNNKELTVEEIRKLIAFYKKEYKRLEAELRKEEKRALTYYDKLLTDFNNEKESKNLLSEKYIKKRIEDYHQKLEVFKHDSFAVWVIFTAVIVVITMVYSLGYFNLENYSLS